MMDASSDTTPFEPLSSFGVETIMEMPQNRDDLISKDIDQAPITTVDSSLLASAPVPRLELPASSVAPANATASNNFSNPWSSVMGGIGSLTNVARNASGSGLLNMNSNNKASDSSASNGEEISSITTANTINSNGNKANVAPSSGNAFFSNLTSNITSSVQTIHQPLQSFTKSISRNISGINTLPDKTTASQVLMFRQLLHTKCRPGLRLSRNYEGTAAQMAVLHMPWWERGIEQSKKMIISYDNLITRLWLSGAIMPFEKGGYASLSPTGSGGKRTGSIDTLINERGLPPVPHTFWIDRLGFQQDDPVTDFRSGGVLSLAMLVHIVESCPAVHSRFVPKPKSVIDSTRSSEENNSLTLEEIITDDASVLPFGITCINITDMLAKFLLFSKAIDKMDALLSAKPFWRMFIDPNSMLVLQEVSLDLLCDVCVEIGRERRVQRLMELEKGTMVNSTTDGQRKMPGTINGKVTVFDFSEIMERTEKRVSEEVLGAGPQNVEELRAIARRVKSKYLLRIQLKEKHSLTNHHGNDGPVSPLGRQVGGVIVPPIPSKEAVKNVTNSVIGGVGGLVSMLRRGDNKSQSKGTVAEDNEDSTDMIDFTSGGRNSFESTMHGGQEVEINLDGTTTSSVTDDLFGSRVELDSFTITSPNNTNAAAMNPIERVEEVDELEKLSAELGELSVEGFDLLGDDFDVSNFQDVDHTEELLDAMDVKLDPMTALFAIDDGDLLS